MAIAAWPCSPIHILVRNQYGTLPFWGDCRNRRRRDGFQGRAQGAVWAVKWHCWLLRRVRRGVTSVSHRLVIQQAAHQIAGLAQNSKVSGLLYFLQITLMNILRTTVMRASSQGLYIAQGHYSSGWWPKNPDLLLKLSAQAFSSTPIHLMQAGFKKYHPWLPHFAVVAEAQYESPQ